MTLLTFFLPSVCTAEGSSKCCVGLWRLQYTEQNPHRGCCIKTTQARIYGKTPPTSPFLGSFAYPTPRGWIVGLTPFNIIILPNKIVSHPLMGFGRDPPRPTHPTPETQIWGGGGSKMTSPSFGSNITNLLGFSYFEPKKSFRVPAHGVTQHKVRQAVAAAHAVFS